MESEIKLGNPPREEVRNNTTLRHDLQDCYNQLRRGEIGKRVADLDGGELIMDRYKEALEKARELHGTIAAGRDFLAEIFPELRESEDERVRKALISLIYENSHTYKSFAGIALDSMIAQLEKQKDLDKMIVVSPEVWDKAIADAYENGKKDGEKQKEQIPYIDFVIKPHKGDDTNPYDMSVSEAQEYAIKRGFGIPFNDGEVYVDERHITQTIGNIIRWADEHPKEQNLSESCDNICCEDDRFKIIGEAKKDIIEKTNIAENELSMELPLLDGILMRVWQIGWLNKKQKPAEWSKNDTVFLNEITDFFENKTVRLQHDMDMYAHWLKFLPERFNLQPKQEWTIEDARPGDILHTSSTASSKTFIFKRIRNDEHGSVECFCCYDSEDGFRKGEEELIGWKTDKYRLATPKQCIKLGRIMGKAGYIFHFETNQLQKLNKLHWKPSKEQINALYDILHPADPVNLDTIKSLYNDLKRL